MIYRKLGKSDLKISAVTFGAWAIGGWMWGGTDRKEAVAAIQAGLDAGINTIDTAAVYGFGLSEELVGRAVAEKRDKVLIFTKYGLRWNIKKGEAYFTTRDNDGKPVELYKYAAPESIVYECEQSLKRLKTDYIDLYQIHWPDPTTPVEETMAACEKLIQQGKIRAAGVSNYNTEQVKAASAVIPLASNQIPYSMINRENEEEVIPYCLQNKIGILAYSPLQRGLLTGKITENYKFKPGDHREKGAFFKKENIIRVNKLLKNLQPLAQSKKATLAQLVINWTTHRPGITAALVGARNRAQALENAGALNFTLTDDEIARIDAFVHEVEFDLSR
jgi:aryl-alcohol dehydrogenase-like predicted oxidoreductase